MVAMIKAGTKNDSPQGEEGVLAQNEGITVPRMFPTDVWAFHIPMMNPRLREGEERVRETG